MRLLPNQTIITAWLAGVRDNPRPYLLRAAAGSMLLVCFLLLTTCSPRMSTWHEIRRTGELRMATVNSATTYYLDASGPTGFEYDLARRLATDLGLKLTVKVVPNRRAAITAVRQGNAHFAAGLAGTPNRRKLMRFTPSYYQQKPQVVVRGGPDKPETLADMQSELMVPAHTAIAEWLQRNHPELNLTIEHNTNSEELLLRVANGKIAATVADANVVKINQRYYPDLRVAFSIDTSTSLAWAFPRKRSEALYNRAVAFLTKIKGSEELRILRDRYFGHADRLGFVGGQAFAQTVKERLDRWRDEFKTAAKRHQLDWRLLAAIGYQESHWNPDAVSPTGVRGLMMLTEATAQEVGIADRTDPHASIRGGAEYFKDLRSRLPEAIKEPDRTWAALAAYNVGMGHLMDVRRLLKARGRDPNRWVNLRTGLEWLTRESYHQQTRYGYARGQEAIAYVGNIRAYYDILLWMTSDTDMEKPEALSGDTPVREPPEERALDIDTPAL